MDFKTCLITDQRIADITDSEDFCVLSGAANNTYQRFSYNTNSSSMLSFNIQIPNESVCTDRYIYLRSQMNIDINIVSTVNPANGTSTINGQAVTPTAGGNPGTVVFSYGNTDSFGSFPLMSSFSTLQSTINNANVSVNIQDVLPILKRMNDIKHLTKYNSLTPAQPDLYYGNYTDYDNSPIKDITTSSINNTYINRGSWNLDSMVVNHSVTYATSGLAGDDHLLNVAPVDDGTANHWKTAESWKISISATFTEPIMLSPYLYFDSEFNKQAFLSLNTLTFTFNVDATLKNVWSSSNPYISSITPSANGLFTQPEILMNFLSLQPSQMKSTKNVLPYQNIERYISNFNNSIGAGGTLQLTTNNIQLNSIPDLIILYVPVPSSSLLNVGQINPCPYNVPSSFFTIENVSINFNNASGLLSSATKEQLWKMTRRFSQISWQEFDGKFNVNLNTGFNSSIPSSGSYLVISPSIDLSLGDAVSEGSIGQYNFQATLTIKNQYALQLPSTLATNTGLSVYTMIVQSGIFVTDNGVSNSFISLLTKEEVLKTKAEKPVEDLHTGEYERLVGGMSNRHLFGMKNIMKKKHRKPIHQLKGAGETGGSITDYEGAGSTGGVRRSAKKGLKYY